MSRDDVLRTRICDLLGIEHPVISAGMGFVARAELAAAVSNAGGLGVVGGAGMQPERLRLEIRRCRELNLRLADSEESTKIDFIVFLTVQTMNYLHSGRHRVAL